MDQSVSAGHLLALGLTVGSVALLVPLARRWPGRWVVAFSWLLAVLLVGNELLYQAVQWTGAVAEPYVPRQWSVGSSLPLYVCDVAAFVGGAALVWRRKLLVEVLWFWAVAGTVQGILTPDHPIRFPSYDWAEFYIDHIGVVLAAFWLVVGLGLHPRAGAVPRVIGITVLFLGMVGAVDALTGGDYDYLHSSSPPGLLRLIGPWPWYLLAATGVALALIVLLDLPFWPERRRAGRQREAMRGTPAERPASTRSGAAH